MKYTYEKNHFVGSNYTAVARKIVEKVIGRKLPPNAEIHHVNGDPSDNTLPNLVICEDHAYHHLLHTRTESFLVCGHANWRKCRYCGQYDSVENLQIDKGGHSRMYHKSCGTKASRLRRAGFGELLKM